MEMDVNLGKSLNPDLKTISSGSYNNNTNPSTPSNNNVSSSLLHDTTPIERPYSIGCCGILGRLLCSNGSRGKTGSCSNDYNNINLSLLSNSNNSNSNNLLSTPSKGSSAYVVHATYAHNPTKQQRKPLNRRTPQEIYFESRGKSCKKLLKFNGNCNKILLYPEEGWARTASSSYWTITPCWWQPNRCRIEEFAGTQRRTAKAKMVSLEQKGSLLISGHFRSKTSSSATSAAPSASTSFNSASAYAATYAAAAGTTTNANPNQNGGSVNGNNIRNGLSNGRGRGGFNSSAGRNAHHQDDAEDGGASRGSRGGDGGVGAISCCIGGNNSNRGNDKDVDEFKLYLSSNITMEDYNMGYCLTGFVERRCQQTNTFQMTHFAVIKRQWPSIANTNKSSTSFSSSS